MWESPDTLFPGLSKGQAAGSAQGVTLGSPFPGSQHFTGEPVALPHLVASWSSGSSAKICPHGTGGLTLGHSRQSMTFGYPTLSCGLVVLSRSTHLAFTRSSSPEVNDGHLQT